MTLNSTVNAENQLKMHGTKDVRVPRSTLAAQNFDTTFNGTLAVHILDGLTLNFYVSTKKLQVQGLCEGQIYRGY